MSLQAVVELLRERVGIDPAALGMGMFEKALATRMQACGIDDVPAYVSYAGVDAKEFQALAEEVSVPETWFFRGGLELFARLASIIRDATAKRPFRVLSVPCSSGEEPYSLAIALAEAGVAPSAWSIEGIDLSMRALEQARTGRYRAFSFRQTEVPLRERYFRTVDGAWEITSPLREHVRFRQGNLMGPLIELQPCSYDLIFCRHLLIYLHAAARARVVAGLERLLAPDGLVCVGSVESFPSMEKGFQLFDVMPPCVYRRREESAIRERAPTLTPAIPRNPPSQTGNQAGHEARLPEPARPVSDLPARSKPGPPATGYRNPLERPAKKGTVPLKQGDSPLFFRTLLGDELTRARQLADAGQIADALAICMASLDRAGPSAGAFALLGVLQQARHDQNEATRCFEKALYLDPNHEEALTHLMLLYRQRGEMDRAAVLRRRLTHYQAQGEP